MCQFSDMVLHVRQISMKRQTEINLKGYLLHSRFELTWIQIGQDRAEGHRTTASYIP